MGKMRQFRRMLRGCAGKPLAFQIRDGYGATIAGFLEHVVKGRVHDNEIYAFLAEDDADGDARRTVAESLATPRVIAAPQKGQKATALVSVRGICTYEIEYQPLAFSSLYLSQVAAQLESDNEIGTVVFDFDTPGGMVTGTPECADAIYRLRKKKKTVALVNPLCASAGYWLASQCEEIVSTPSGDCGSIGVFMAHTDCSKLMEDMGVRTSFIYAGEHKTEGNMFEPLAESARTYYQSEVDTIYKDFLGAVARGRGISVENVEKKFGQGRTMMAPAAKKSGMIDSIATVDQAMARYGVTTIAVQGRKRGESADTPQEAQAADETATDKKQNKIVTELIVDARGVEAGTAQAIRAFDAMREAADKAREAVEQANAAATPTNKDELGTGSETVIHEALSGSEVAAEYVRIPLDELQEIDTGAIELVHDAPDDNKQLDPANATIKLSEGSLADFKLELDLSCLDKNSVEKASPAASEARRRRLELLSA